jgi:SAM-dependent methyltransferase
MLNAGGEWRSPAAGRLVMARARRLFDLARASRGRLRLTLGREPLSVFWGHERGLPICRYYLDQFLQEHAADIRGRCLEFADDWYTSRFGGRAVAAVDILHLDDSNPKATIVGDLTKENDIPGDRFDCITCTFVLHVIAELDKAVATLHRILRPGGVLLVAVPHISMCDPQYHELWRFTPEGLSRLLGTAFGARQVTVHAYGNSLTAAGQIRGLVPDEFTQAELDHRDERFAVTVCARAVKQG